MSKEAVVTYFLLKGSEYLEPEVVQWARDYNACDKAINLRDKRDWINACLKDAQKSQAKRKCGNERERLWMAKLTEIREEADEAIDNFIAVTRQPKWRRSLPFGNPLRKAAQEIDVILEKLAKTMANKSEFGIESFARPKKQRLV